MTASPDRPPPPRHALPLRRTPIRSANWSRAMSPASWATAILTIVAPNLGLYGWIHGEPTDGIAIAQPGVGGDTFALIADDASFCHVESMTIGTQKAAETLALALPAAGTTLPDPGTDAAGCALYDLGSGITATLTSGGAEPTCTSDTTSTVRFDFAPAE